MLASCDTFLAVEVELLRVAPLFSWMMTVSVSPMACAFLSENIEIGCALLSFHSESAATLHACASSRKSVMMVGLKSNENSLFIFYLSVEFPLGFRIADADGL